MIAMNSNSDSKRISNQGGSTHDEKNVGFIGFEFLPFLLQWQGGE